MTTSENILVAKLNSAKLSQQIIPTFPPFLRIISACVDWCSSNSSTSCFSSLPWHHPLCLPLICRSASPLLLWPPHCPLWTRDPLSAANRAFTEVHNRPHESTPAILRCFRGQDNITKNIHYKGRHKTGQGSNLWVESGLICGENLRDFVSES